MAVPLPKIIDDPHDIDGPVIVKYAGAKGGEGYFIARIIVIFVEMSTWIMNLRYKNMF